MGEKIDFVRISCLGLERGFSCESLNICHDWSSEMGKGMESVRLIIACDEGIRNERSVIKKQNRRDSVVEQA